jgi:CRP/FNR family transcriptional regulator, cyclic AMP receptor protein
VFVAVAYDSPPANVADRISHSLVAALARVPLFADLDDRALLDLVGAACNFCWHEGSVVFEEGSDAEALFVVISGSVQIVDVDDGREVEIASAGPGQFFGEHSLLLRRTHSKRAVAREDTELMVLSKQQFDDLLAERPALEAQIRQGIEEHLKEAETAEPSV